jgi:hypothetical protein
MKQTLKLNTTRSAALMTEEQIASATGDAIPRRRLQQLRQCGGGPPFLKIGRRVLYDWNDVRGWLDSQKRLSTSDMGVVT